MTAGGAWKAALDSRYPSTGGNTACTTFTTAFGNIWDNYYSVKIPAMKLINDRWTTANTDVTTIKTKLSVL